MSHVPLATMSRLSALKFTDIDPAQLRVAARMPVLLEPRKDGVKVTIAVGLTKMELILEPAVETQELAALSRFLRPGMRLWNFRLSSADSARLQRTIATSGGQHQVSIAAGVDACRRGPLGNQSLPTTTYLRTDASDFFVLAEDLDLRSIIPEQDLLAKVPSCD